MTEQTDQVTQSIHQAVDIIKRGRALEKMLLEAGFTLSGMIEQTKDMVSHPDNAHIETSDGNQAGSEWPQANADGELVDVRGCPWIESAHSAGKSCNDDGTWRKRRGVDKAEIDRLEAQAMQPSDIDQDADNEEPAKEPEAPASDNTGDFAKIQRGIFAAPDSDTVDEWIAYSMEVVITQGQRYALEAAADERKKQIAAA